MLSTRFLPVLLLILLLASCEPPQTQSQTEAAPEVVIEEISEIPGPEFDLTSSETLIESIVRHRKEVEGIERSKAEIAFEGETLTIANFEETLETGGEKKYALILGKLEEKIEPSDFLYDLFLLLENQVDAQGNPLEFALIDGSFLSVEEFYSPPGELGFTLRQVDCFRNECFGFSGFWEYKPQTGLRRLSGLKYLTDARIGECEGPLGLEAFPGMGPDATVKVDRAVGLTESGDCSGYELFEWEEFWQYDEGAGKWKQKTESWEPVLADLVGNWIELTSKEGDYVWEEHECGENPAFALERADAATQKAMPQPWLFTMIGFQDQQSYIPVDLSVQDVEQYRMLARIPSDQGGVHGSEIPEIFFMRWTDKSRMILELSSHLRKPRFFVKKGFESNVVRELIPCEF